MIRTAGKRLLFRFPLAYRWLRRADLFGRYLLRRPHEPEFAAFRLLDVPEALFVDIGANIGQTALSVASVRPGWRIVSFEPNPACAPDLALVRRVIGRRFTYHLCGIGDADGELELTVPSVDGVALLQEGTLHPDSLALDASVARLPAGYALTRHTVPIRRLAPMLPARPDVIKLDVQGHEATILRSILPLVDASRPWLMFETSPADAELAGLLQPLGYRPYVWEAGAARLVEADLRQPVQSLNLFFLPAAPGR